MVRTDGRCRADHAVEFPHRHAHAQSGCGFGGGLYCCWPPSDETPYSALALAELAERAGIPAGVFNVLTGNAPTLVKPWTEDPRVRALSFTGSTEVGRLLYRQCAGTVKKLVLELGGHAPVIVFKGADLDRAVEEVIKAKFATSGQDCLGANRIYVERPIYEAFCERFIKRPRRCASGLASTIPTSAR